MVFLRPRGSTASSSRGWARSTASGRAARRARPAPASRPFAPRRRAGGRPGLVRPAALGREARDGVAEVRAVEGGRLVDLAGQEALAQRAEGHEPDARAPRASAGSPPPAPATTASTRSAARSPAGRRGRGGWSAPRPRTGRSAAPCPAAMSSFTVPATSSIGTFGSTRCW